MVAVMEGTRSIVTDIFRDALAAVDPGRIVAPHAAGLIERYRRERFTRLVVMGFGKAAYPMALAVENACGDLAEVTGTVIVPHGHAGQDLRRVSVVEAGHPLPDANGVTGTEELVRLALQADERTLVLTLISGGGSALLVSPAAGITLQQKQAATDLLLKAGAEIGELNAVRKHLSRVKGGRLAALLHRAATVSLIISDVIGDRLDVIASGPTSPDPSTYADAFAVIERYGLRRHLPGDVVRLLREGMSGLLAETPKPGDPVFHGVENRLVATNRIALAEARRSAAARGLRGEIVVADLAGPARDAGRMLAGKALSSLRERRNELPLCLISGGETTVKVTGTGKGGRNQELALAFAREIEGIEGITFLSGGTDGCDGPTDAAGAVVDGTTVTLARRQGLDPDSFLDRNDSHTFFQRAGGLLVTGPTGTNVMDMQIAVIG